MTTKKPDTAELEQTITALRQQLAQQEHVTRSLAQRVGNMAVEIADRDAVIAQQFAQNMQRQMGAQAEEPGTD